MKNKLIFVKLIMLLLLSLSIITYPLVTGATDVTTMAEGTQSNTTPNPNVNNGQSSGMEINSPLFTLDRYIRGEAGICYGISEEHGFLFSMNSGNTWEERNGGLPLKLIYPFQTPKARYLTSLGVDSSNAARVAVTTTNAIYLSEDYGNLWTKITVSKPVPGGTYLTAIALSPADKNTLLISTSYDGIFETKDRGRSWNSISANLRFLYKGAYFWEEISALAYHPVTGEIIFACGYPGTIVTPSLYRLSPNRKIVQKINLLGLRVDGEETKASGFERTASNETGSNPIDNSQFKKIQDVDNTSNNAVNQVINNLYFKSSYVSETGEQNQNSWFLQVAVRDATWLYPWPESGLSPEKSRNELSLYATLKVENSITRANTSAKIERMQRAAGKLGVYIRWDYAIGKRLDEQLNFIKKNGFNAIVVDLKDDDGYLTYDSKLPTPLKVGAVRKNYRINIEDLLKKAKEKGIYVIGRLVTFKDERLHRYQNFKYAVWNRVTNQSWSTKEFWVDPYAQDVWEYNISIAEELQNLGVDEIQFDYIRFPTDGNISQITYRYRPADQGMIQAEKKDALESFLTKARERITIPISTDLYGFNCWCRMDSINGQNVELISKFVDVVCPMFYPSHFPGAFLNNLEYLERAKVLYQDGATRAYAIVGGRCLIRPYVQAFLLGGETKMAAPTYTKYLLNQLEGVFATPTPGFTLWNYGMKYFMVTKPVSEYLLGREQ